MKKLSHLVFSFTVAILIVAYNPSQLLAINAIVYTQSYSNSENYTLFSNGETEKTVSRMISTNAHTPFNPEIGVQDKSTFSGTVNDINKVENFMYNGFFDEKTGKGTLTTGDLERTPVTLENKNIPWFAYKAGHPGINELVWENAVGSDTSSRTDAGGKSESYSFSANSKKSLFIEGDSNLVYEVSISTGMNTWKLGNENEFGPNFQPTYIVSGSEIPCTQTQIKSIKGNRDCIIKIRGVGGSVHDITPSADSPRYAFSEPKVVSIVEVDSTSLSDVTSVGSLSQTSVSVGAQVSLTGSNLGNSNTILLNGEKIQDTISNGSYVIFTIPEDTAPGSYSIGVINNDTGEHSNILFIEVKDSVSIPESCHVFTQNLQIGSTGSEVSALQSWLNANGFPIYSVSSSTQPIVTGYYGTATADVVKLFQASKGIPATGFVGPLTRAALNGSCSNPQPPVVCPVGYICGPVATSTPSITIISPNGGEEYEVGDTVPISWNTTGFSSTTQIQLMLADKYGMFDRFIGTVFNTGSYSWKTPINIVPYGTVGALKIVASTTDSGRSAYDISDASFTVGSIVAASTTVEMVSTNAVVSTYESGDRGTFTFTIKVSAFGGDIAIPKSVTDSRVSEKGGFVYKVLSGSPNTNAVVTTSSQNGDSSSHFVIKNGQTKTFTVTLVAEPTKSEFVQIGMAAVNDNSVNYKSNSIYLAAPSIPVDTTAPSVPINAQAVLEGDNNIRFTWKASTDTGGSGIAGYKVYRDNYLRETSKSLSAYDDALPANTRYCWSVAAYDNAGNTSAHTANSCVTTKAAPVVETPPVITLNSDVSKAVSGQDVTITMSSTKANSCTLAVDDDASDKSTAEQWAGHVGPVNTSFSISNIIEGNTTFTVTCTGSGGTTTKNLVVPLESTQTVSVVIDSVADMTYGEKIDLEITGSGFDTLENTIIFTGNALGKPIKYVVPLETEKTPKLYLNFNSTIFPEPGKYEVQVTNKNGASNIQVFQVVSQTSFTAGSQRASVWTSISNWIFRR